jgi:flavin reductase (DIM6/NTAB) family NADH-FMN oxidoreductase RutF/DNA-binding IclR family transcriptional regulator
VTTDPGIDPQRFRQVLGHFPTGVVVITGRDDDGSPAGLAIGSFSSVSLDPPLVAFFPDKSSSSWPKIEKSGSFCVNILAAEQEPICRTFATKGGDKFAELTWQPGGTGSPVLDGVVAWIDCDIDKVEEAGDHYMVIGRVRELEIARSTLPLLFFQGGYGRFSPASLSMWESDLAMQLRSADLARPEMEAVADELGAECVVSAVAGDQMVLIATANTSRSREVPINMGQRIPFAPPLGTVFVAWATPEVQKAWLDRLGSDPQKRAAMLATLQEVRRHGYSVGRGRAWHSDVRQLLSRLIPGTKDPSDAELRSELHRLVRTLPADFESPATGLAETVQTINTPVFGPDGSVVLALSLMEATGKSFGEEASGQAHRLIAAAEVVTKALGGIRPEPAKEEGSA